MSRMEALGRVSLRPRGAAEGTFAGPHISVYRGTGVEFSDYRSYSEGDDIRLVDWKLYAKCDRHYVRVYEAERNLLTYLVVDTSGSMEYAGAVQTTDSKLRYAGLLAAALSFLVVREGDEVSLALAGDVVHEYLPPRGSWMQLRTLVAALESATATGTTRLGDCLETVYTRVSRRGVLIILSDFLDFSPRLWTAIDLFRRSKFDVMVFHIIHPEEMELPDVGAARFLDAESADAMFKVEPDVIRTLYRDRVSDFLRTIEGGCRARGCDWYLARTDADPYVFLKRCVLARDVVV